MQELLVGKIVSCGLLAEGTEGVETGGETAKLPARPRCSYRPVDFGGVFR